MEDLLAGNVALLRAQGRLRHPEVDDFLAAIEQTLGPHQRAPQPDHYIGNHTSLVDIEASVWFRTGFSRLSSIEHPTRKLRISNYAQQNLIVITSRSRSCTCQEMDRRMISAAI